MLPVVSNLDLLIVPRRLEAAGYATHQATTLFGYLTGMSVPLINLATILTAAMAMSLVPAISHSFTLKEYGEIRERTATSMRIAFLVTIPSVSSSTSWQNLSSPSSTTPRPQQKRQGPWPSPSVS